MANQNSKKDIRKLLDEFNKSSSIEFNYLLDYIWKSKGLIDYEWEIEKKKLKHYFGNDIEMKMLRMTRERHKLFNIFPESIAKANVFLTFSIFETKIMGICRLIEGYSSNPINGHRTGIRKYLTYMQSEFKDIEKIRNWRLINNFIHIRNCLMHTNGFLRYQKNSKVIKDIVKQKNFLPPPLVENISYNNEIQIVNSPQYGERLLIDNNYPFNISAIARDFIQDVCCTLINNYDNNLFSINKK
ncbi:MAG: hypothetical protein KAU20_01835 [Nanoarchaeota archaeon]|nr:hypothetical protein [Nanoarchaeota archaeon]